MVVNATQQQHQGASPTFPAFVLIQISLKTSFQHVTEQPMDGRLSTHKHEMCVFLASVIKHVCICFSRGPWTRRLLTPENSIPSILRNKMAT